MIFSLENSSIFYRPTLYVVFLAQKRLKKSNNLLTREMCPFPNSACSPVCKTRLHTSNWPTELCDFNGHSLIGSDDGIQQKPIFEVSLHLIPIHIIELSYWTLDFDAYLVIRFQRITNILINIDLFTKWHTYYQSKN